MSSNHTPRPSVILIWLGGALGDTLLAYPALAALRAWAPRARITAIGGQTFLRFALQAGLLDRLESGDGALANQLFGDGAAPCQAPPDLAVVWSSAYRHLAERLQGWGVRSIIAAPPRAAYPRHQSRYLLDCLRVLGVPRAVRPAPAPPLADLTTAERALLGPEGQPTALLHPGAGAAWKQWPLARFLALARPLARDVAVRWSFGPADGDLRAALAHQAPNPPGSVWPELELERFAALLGRCNLVVTTDTGVAHLAALLRVPQVTLFGPTDPRRWRPLSRVAVVVRAPTVCGDRWPLAEDGGEVQLTLRRCRAPRGDQCQCLAELPEHVVFTACASVLRSPRSDRSRVPRPAQSPAP